MNKSIATISSPEFINLEAVDRNPLMSSCEIKVLYIGENRNHSYITKEVAAEMAKTLRGAPIVGYFKPEKEDFADHGNRVTIDDEGIKFDCLTKPYGFVSPDAKVWFQWFDDEDEFGNTVSREYLMTTGYLWTGQFEECRLAVEGEGKPQSMELDEKTLNGHWSRNEQKNMDFFIINDATFSKLCILGEDVEPCFEGAKVSAPEVSTAFTKVDDNFKKTLFNMMQDLQFALRGGNMLENETVLDVAETPIEETLVETPVAEESVLVDEEQAPAVIEEEVVEENEPVVEEAEVIPAEEPIVEEVQPVVETEPSEFELLQKDYATLKENFERVNLALTEANYELEKSAKAMEEMSATLTELREFKANVLENEKDEMIASFTMLSDEDKEEVIANKSKYTLDEIESKLSVIAVRKKVNFASNNDEESNTKKVYTYNLPKEDEGTIPAWVKAIKNNKK